MKVGEFFDEWNIKYRELDETDIDMEDKLITLTA